jgi:radical SAM protein with 4Fe4S-binding SPASM domain
MHPRFFDMVSYAANRGIRVGANSNLTLLSEARAKRCVTSGLDSLQISFDGAARATYEEIRVGASFERVGRNIEKLVNVRSRAGTRRPRLQLVVVAMRRNLKELPQLVRLAHRWSLDGVFVQQLGHEFDEPALDPRYGAIRRFVRREALAQEDSEQIDRCFAEARAVAGELAIPLRLPRVTRSSSPPMGGRKCEWPWSGMYLSYRGDVMPCCMVATPDRLSLGNAAERGIHEVWNDEPYQTFRKRLDSEDPPDVCRSCAVYRGIF